LLAAKVQKIGNATQSPLPSYISHAPNSGNKLLVTKQPGHMHNPCTHHNVELGAKERGFFGVDFQEQRLRMVVGENF
jgi:hypothetical protein